MKLTINSTANLQDDNGGKIGTTNKVVEIAELGENDIAGIVEALQGKRNMLRNITAFGGAVEVFTISVLNFTHNLNAVPKVRRREIKYRRPAPERK